MGRKYQVGYKGDADKFIVIAATNDLNKAVSLAWRFDDFSTVCSWASGRIGRAAKIGRRHVYVESGTPVFVRDCVNGALG